MERPLKELLSDRPKPVQNLLKGQSKTSHITDEEVKKFRNALWSLTRGTGRDREHFKLKVNISGDPSIITTYDLMQWTGEEWIEVASEDSMEELLETMDALKEEVD